MFEQGLTKEYLIQHKQDLIRYENEYNTDFSQEIKETDKIIMEFISKELKHVNTALWEEKQIIQVKVKEGQQRLI